MTPRRSPAFEAGRKVGYVLGLLLCATVAGVLLAGGIWAAIHFR